MIQLFIILRIIQYFLGLWGDSGKGDLANLEVDEFHSLEK